MQKLIVKEKVSKTGKPYVALLAVDDNGRETIISFEATKIFKVLPSGVGYKDIDNKGITIGELYE